MARSTDDMLAQLLRFLPEQYRASEALLSGIAAQLARAELAADDLLQTVTVAGAEGKWLTLMVHGYGLRRRTDQTDEALRTMLRRPEGQLTGPAILERINALIAFYTTQQATIVEWWESSAYLDYDFFLGIDSRLPVAWHSFVLILPAALQAGWERAYLDYNFFLGVDSFLGRGTHQIVPVIVEEVYRLRAAGVRAWVAVDTI